VLGSAAIGSPRYQLVDDGHLTADQRVALAVEDGAATLTTQDARQITNVLHHRITDNSGITLDPIGHSCAEWVPGLADCAGRPADRPVGCEG
jgi:hypothetical protein